MALGVSTIQIRGGVEEQGPQPWQQHVRSRFTRALIGLDVGEVQIQCITRGPSRDMNHRTARATLPTVMMK